MSGMLRRTHVRIKECQEEGSKAMDGREGMKFGAGCRALFAMPEQIRDRFKFCVNSKN